MIKQTLLNVSKNFCVILSVASAVSVVLGFSSCVFLTAEAAESAEYLIERFFVSFYSVASAVFVVLDFSFCVFLTTEAAETAEFFTERTF
ncbi:MAG: hypothetical protein N4A49_03610 [Marinifilaceae bacterium]|jgi:hypothetical protein|nr:hypothetical protein [Marinifilaceae bacterium]